MTVKAQAGQSLNAAQRESFDRDGFLVLDDPCPPELIDQVLKESNALYQNRFHPGPEINDDGVIFQKHMGGVEDFHWHRVMNAWKREPGIRGLALAPRVLAVTEELFGRRVLPFQSLNFPVGTEQPPHIDAFFFSSDPGGYMCGVWVALEDMDMDNGPLVYYPGSHKLPLPEWSEIAEVSGMSVERDGYATEEEFRTARGTAFTIWAKHRVEHEGLEPQYGTIRKGQAVIWAANLMHGGAPQNDKQRTRHSQVTHYYFEGCRHFSPLHTEGRHVYYKYPEWIREPPPETTVETIREAVQQVVPAGSTVLVAGAGWGLLDLVDRTAWPFPQDEQGNQATLDEPGTEAVEQLERLRSKGAEYVIFPEDQLWWLEYKATALQEHIEDRYEGVFRDGAYGAVYALTDR